MKKAKPGKMSVSSKALKAVLGGLVKAAEKEREKDPKYKKLFEGSDGIEGVLRDVEHNMLSSALDGLQVLQRKYGLKKGSGTFDMLCCLPLMVRILENRITAKEGFVCSVDKVYYLLAQSVRSEIKEG